MKSKGSFDLKVAHLINDLPDKLEDSSTITLDPISMSINMYLHGNYQFYSFAKYFNLSCKDTIDKSGRYTAEWFLDTKNLEEINDILINQENSTTYKKMISLIESKYPK